jgi:D-sedoheptulose 7-phosphate isomerase
VRKSKPTIQEFVEDYLTELKKALDRLDIKKVEQAIEMLMEAYREGRRVFILGNGGSAATASHMACDLGKGTLSRVYDKKERRFRVMSLTDNVSLLTAFANDLSFDDIFIQQLRNLLEKDDLLIVLSGSGSSSNVIRAVKYAQECRTKTIGFLGFKTGGKLAKLVDCPIIIQSNRYGPIEDAHLVLDHIITSWLAKVKKD